MFPSPSKLLFGAVITATALFDLVHAGDCDNGPFAFIWKIGERNPDQSKGMVPFCATLWDVGYPITGLDVWYDPNQGINAVAVQYTNGDKSAPYGVPGSSPQHESFTWDYSQTLVQSLSLWGNGGGGQLGNIRLTLTDGRVLDVGNRNDGHSTKTEFPIDVASGVMLGFGGWGGDNIKQGFFLFLKSQIDHIRMSNPVFDDSPENLNAQQRGLERKTLDSADHHNVNDSANETFTFANSITKQDTTSTSSTLTHTLGVKFSTEWEAKILEIGVKNNIELSYEFSDAQTKSTSSQTTVSVSWTVGTTVKPGGHIFCQATAMLGQADLGYSAQIDIMLKDGSSWSFSERGIYSQVVWSQASSLCQDHPFIDGEDGSSKRAVKFIA